MQISHNPELLHFMGWLSQNRNKCDRFCKRGSYSLSICMHLTIHYETCEYGINLKFGHITLLTWFCFWEQFYINRMNTLWVITNWIWKLRKAIRPLFTDSVTHGVSLGRWRNQTSPRMFWHPTASHQIIIQTGVFTLMVVTVVSNSNRHCRWSFTNGLVLHTIHICVLFSYAFVHMPLGFLQICRTLFYTFGWIRRTETTSDSYGY